MNKESFIYIITNQYNTTFYVGVTSNLIKRIYEHKNKMFEGFSNNYNLTKLVYFEVFDNIQDAITREKQIKNWHRKWKQNLIENSNPKYIDLYNKISNCHAELVSASQDREIPKQVRNDSRNDDLNNYIAK